MDELVRLSVTEEEIESGPAERDAFGMADGAVGCVLDCAVALHMADGPV